jgi:hypothetical protein
MELNLPHDVFIYRPSARNLPVDRTADSKAREHRSADKEEKEAKELPERQ